MNVQISAWAIRNPTPIAILFLALTVIGIYAYITIPIKRFPDISFAFITVTVVQEGAAPSELETQVTRVIEDAVANIPRVDGVQSTITQGVSFTGIAFEIGMDTQEAMDKVRSAIDSVRSDLPREIEEPLIEREELEGEAIIVYSVSARSMSDAELSWFVDDTVARRLVAMRGVAEVRRVGGVDREINVVLDPQRLAALGVTAPQINDALRGFNVDASGGRAEIGGVEQSVRVLGAASSVDALRELTIPSLQGFVKLSDVASVGDGTGESRGFARLNGRPVVGFQVFKTKESSEVTVEDGIVEAVAELQAAYPDVTFTPIVSLVDVTRTSYRETVNVLLEGMLLAAVVVFLFLRNWRTTFIAALAMPMSMIPTFAVMNACGFSLNLVSMLALTLVVGILVDDAIVEIENIQKRVTAGATPYRAAYIGADAIGLAVVATTLCIVVVFVPVSFMPGIGGQYFAEFGLTVAVAVLFSLVVARLLTPLLAAYFLSPVAEPHERGPLPTPYLRSLRWALDHRKTSVALGGAMFVGALFIATQLPAGFVPAGDEGFFSLRVQGSPGATRKTMESSIADVTERLMGHPDVELVFATVGGTGASADLRSGGVTIVLRDDRVRTTEEVKEDIRPLMRTIADARVVTSGGEAGSGSDVEISLAGFDGAALEEASLRLQREMRDVNGITDVRTATPPVGPEIVIRPRPEEAARLGVTSTTIATIVRVATIGEVDANVSKFSSGERRIPIRVRLPDTGRGDLSVLENLRVPTASGGTTPLASVAEIEFRAGPGRIERYERERRILVQADLQPGFTLGQAMTAISRLPALTDLPPTVRLPETGDAEAMAEVFGGFAVAIATGIGLIYGVMVLLFGSFFKPVTILSALPLSIGGAFLSLWVFGLAVEMPVLIGLMMLMGVAAKNSILLVDFAIVRERAGASQRQALLDACNERARPIVMTTCAMAAGMLPAALGIGEGSEFRQGMAIAVIGGLISSTALSLVLVPVVYEFVDDWEEWLKPRLGRLVTRRTQEDDALSTTGRSAS